MERIVIKRTSKIFGIPGFICFAVGILWGEEIEAYSLPLYYLMLAVIIIGVSSHYIQDRRDREKAIADNAVAKYKEEIAPRKSTDHSGTIG